MNVLVAVNTHSRRGRTPLGPALGVFAEAGWNIRHERAERSAVRWAEPLRASASAKRQTFDLADFGRRADHVTMHFNSGHPGVDVPHYHVVVWHVSKRAESRVAK
jgi:hypothetical protein